MKSVIQVEKFLAEDVEDCFSVGFGFKSEISEDDVLFIVCAKEQEIDSPPAYQNGLYFERFDQTYSAHDCAESILVKNHSVDIDFTSDGYTQLRFPTKRLRFSFGSAEGDFSKIRDVLEKMSNIKGKNVISFAD